MNDRRRLLVYMTMILSLVALTSVVGAAIHFGLASVSRDEPGGDWQAGFFRACWLSAGTTLVLTAAGGTLMLRAASPFIRRLQDSEAANRRQVDMLQQVRVGLEAKVNELLNINTLLDRAGLDGRQDADTLEQLQNAHIDLDHFVRALSHDMNANFMVLEHSFNVLRHTPADGAAQEAPALAHVEACLRESKRYLDDLHTLAKTGTVHLAPQRVDLPSVVDEVLQEQVELLDHCGVRVVVEPNLPSVWCNENRVKQVLTNLVRNAVKHGCDSIRPRITIGPAPTATPGFESFRVHDNGPGIPPAARQEIFIPGRRLPTAGGEGTGMGLAIVKRIANHYGGDVQVDDRCDSGTAFLVSLPRVGALSVPHGRGVAVS